MGIKGIFADNKFRAFPKDIVAIKDTESFILNLKQVMEEIFYHSYDCLAIKKRT